MDKVYIIRHKVLAEGKSISSVARELGISRNTVKKYLIESEPVRKQTLPRGRPVMDRVGPRIDEILEEWRHRVTPKQHITGVRILRQLREDGFQAGITTVRDYLREKRRQSAEVYIPLVYRPGDEGQFDFFEVTVEEKGQLRPAWKLLLHLPYSERDYLNFYDSCDQLAFLDGHVRAAACFGGLPHRIVYDNLSAAVKHRVGLAPQLTERFKALVSHYLCSNRVSPGRERAMIREVWRAGVKVSGSST